MENELKFTHHYYPKNKTNLIALLRIEGMANERTNEPVIIETLEQFSANDIRVQ